ncbi:MAG: S8 family serine peptidase, partial [Chloroflexi bacterium]|nr:S8 family serine peptidase [Chloroflexota bacterium]
MSTSPAAPTRRFAAGLVPILAVVLSLAVVLVPGARAADAATLPTASTDIVPMAAIGRSTATRPYIVVLRPGTLGSKRGLMAKRERGRLVTSTARSVPGIEVRFRYTASMAGFVADLTPAQVRQLDADPTVARIVPDVAVSVSAVTPAVTAARADTTLSDAQSTPVGISRVGGASWSDSSRVDVAVVDTGIGMTSDLTLGGELNVVGGTNCSGDGKAAEDIADGHGHGSHVAGTIGARDNDIGVVGIAPGIRLWSVRVFDSSGSGSMSAVICAIDWTAAWADAHTDRRMAVNMSLGGGDFYRASATCGPTGTSADPEHQVICAAVSRGVVFVVAAGNDSADANLTVPARYGEVITVSAIADYDGRAGGLGSRGSCAWSTADDAFASFSNYGSVVDITAPGVCVKSTSRSTVGATVTMSGTSMATPHVTAGAARYLALHGGATPAEVRAGLIAEGSSDWATSTDPDSAHEPRLAVVGPGPSPSPSPSPSP